MTNKNTEEIKKHTKVLNVAARLKLHYIAATRDIRNKIYYGFSAPAFAEKIWIDPNEVDKAIDENHLKQELHVSTSRLASGKIVSDRKLFKKVYPVERINKIKFCIEHWEEGHDWEETGAIDYMAELISQNGKVDGCADIEDVYERYKSLDEIYKEVKEERRIKSMEELHNNNFREFGGVFVHLGPEGEPYLGMGGLHRFAIAKTLNIRQIPAQIGIVHQTALPVIPEFRKKK